MGGLYGEIAASSRPTSSDDPSATYRLKKTPNGISGTGDSLVNRTEYRAPKEAANCPEDWPEDEA